jgi:hypothetical protein
MLKENDVSALEYAMTLDQRRAFLKLSIAERRKILAQQADEVVRQYESDESVRERESWQGGDIVEY